MLYIIHSVNQCQKLNTLKKFKGAVPQKPNTPKINKNFNAILQIFVKNVKFVYEKVILINARFEKVAIFQPGINSKLDKKFKILNQKQYKNVIGVGFRGLPPIILQIGARQMSNENLYDSKQASQILNLSPLTITKLVRDGKLKAFKIGREWIFTSEDLKSYLANKANKVN